MSVHSLHQKKTLAVDFNVTHPQTFPLSIQGTEWAVHILCENQNDNDAYKRKVSLQLLNGPQHYKDIVVCARLFCLNLSTSKTMLVHYNHKREYNVAWEDGIVSISPTEMRQQFNNNLMFSVNVRILRIISNDNQIVYQNKLHSKYFRQNVKLNWSINNDSTLFRNMKQASSSKTSFESKVFEQMWIIKVYPFKTTVQKQGRHFEVVLQICSLPQNKSEIMIDFTLHLNHKTVQYHDAIFNYKQSSYNCGPIISFEEFQQFHKLNIFIEIQTKMHPIIPQKNQTHTNNGNEFQMNIGNILNNIAKDSGYIKTKISKFIENTNNHLEQNENMITQNANQYHKTLRLIHDKLECNDTENVTKSIQSIESVINGLKNNMDFMHKQIVKLSNNEQTILNQQKEIENKMDIGNKNDIIFKNNIDRIFVQFDRNIMALSAQQRNINMIVTNNQNIIKSKLDSIEKKNEQNHSIYSAQIGDDKNALNDIDAKLKSIDNKINEYCTMKESNVASNELEEIRLWLENEVQLPQFYDTFVENGFFNLSTICNYISTELLSEIAPNMLIGHKLEILKHAERWKKVNNNNNGSTSNISQKRYKQQIKKETEKYKSAITQIQKCFVIEHPKKYLSAAWAKCNELKRFVWNAHKLDSDEEKYVVHDIEHEKYLDRIREFIEINRNNQECNDQIINIYKSNRKICNAFKSNVKHSEILETYTISEHPRIDALNKEKALKTNQAIGAGTVIGEYTAKYILATDLDQLNGTDLFPQINEYAFNQSVDVRMTLEQIQYFQSSDIINSNFNKTRKRKRGRNGYDLTHNNTESPSSKKQKLNNHNINKRDDNNHNKAEIKYKHSFNIVMDGWSNEPQSMLCFMNDCRKYLNLSHPTEEDEKHFNVELVPVLYRGWPRIFGIAKRNILKDEELTTFYGDVFIGVKKEQKKLKKRKEKVNDILSSVGLKL